MSDAQYVFRHGTRKRVYADFRAASKQTFGLPTLAHKLRIADADTEAVEQIAYRMAEAGRLTLYIGRQGISEVGIPWRAPEAE